MQTEGSLTVAFYNVENLFDTIDDPRVNDNEFLPNSKKEWTEKRYQAKLEDISRVFHEMGGRDLPFLIGLCEVENKRVVEDLADTKLLRPGKYGIVHYDSPDGRGIDVALMYRSEGFKVNHSSIIPVQLPERSRPTSRDILYVRGKIASGEELHVFVNHWASRAGGVDQTEPGRIAAAEALRKGLDSLLEKNPGVKIIIMGDLNDTPERRSLQGILKAFPPGSADTTALVNLMYPLSEKGQGSYNYRGNWDMLDHIIVSPALMKSNGLSVEGNSGFIFKPNWLAFTNSYGQRAPNRTYVGDRYVGGISDHFPVYIRLVSH